MSRLEKAAPPPSAEYEIEVTPEMIEAGIEEYALFDFFDPGEWVVSAIYRAMAAKAPLSQVGMFPAATEGGKRGSRVRK